MSLEAQADPADAKPAAEGDQKADDANADSTKETNLAELRKKTERLENESKAEREARLKAEARVAELEKGAAASKDSSDEVSDDDLVDGKTVKKLLAKAIETATKAAQEAAHGAVSAKTQADADKAAAKVVEARIAEKYPALWEKSKAKREELIKADPRWALYPEQLFNASTTEDEREASIVARHVKNQNRQAEEFSRLPGMPRSTEPGNTAVPREPGIGGLRRRVRATLEKSGGNI